MRSAQLVFGSLVMAVAMTTAGCLQGAIEENQRQLNQQKAELDQLKQDVAALKAAQRPTYPTTPALPGSCDAAVMRLATQRGGASFAASNFGRALGYYHDALTACPGDAQAELNVARAYEALGERAQAVSHYKRASQSTSDSAAAEQARRALARLNAK